MSAAGDVASGAMLYSCAFDGDPLRHGWRWTPSPGGDMAFVASEGWYPDKGGRLDGPRLAAVPDPCAYYRLRFRSRTARRGYWAVTTQDAAGADQVDDAYAAIHPSDGWIEHDAAVRNRDGAATVSISFQGRAPISVADLRVEVIDAAMAAALGDRLYAGLPPLAWTPPAGRWRRLPRTLGRLRSGGELRVVQLGDSIVNDTNNGNWDALVGRLWPRARLRMLTSVRGSTGCWHYRIPEHFAAYVASRKPDLVLIGGISNQLPGASARSALADLRAVAARVQDEIGCELALMSGPIGEDWRRHDPALPGAALPESAPPQVPEFVLGMEAVAAELGVAFIDCHRAWHGYLGASRKPWQWFHRDAVHADDRGKQIVARMLERWFTEEPG